MTKTTQAADRDIFISRVIDAPQQRVWRALSNSDELAAWWGPIGFKDVTSVFSFKPGGIWKHVMIGPDGIEYPNTVKYEEIVEPERIVFVNSGGKKGGRGISFRSTWALKDISGKTEVSIHMVFKTAEDRDFVVREHHAIEGGQQTLARLNEHVSKNSPDSKPGFELRLERTIKAPRERVWQAWADPKQLVQWFAPQPLTLSIEKMEFHADGRFAMTMHFPDGPTHAFSGTYREIVPQSKIIWTGEFPDDPANNMRTEITFEDHGAQTKINVLQTFAVITPVNEQATKGANQGWTMTLNQLDAFCRG